MQKIREFHEYISPDGKVYNLTIPSRKGRWVMQSSGWGTPPIEYITQRGTFQHGETVKDYFLTPRTIQLLINQSFCDRNGQWEGRADLLDAIRPNRQLTATGVVPGTLRRVLSDGSIRDLKVFIADGPSFDPDQDGWQEHSFKEVLRFVAHDPVIYDPTLQSYIEDFSTLGHTLEVQQNSALDNINIFYDSANWDIHPNLQILVGYNGNVRYKAGSGIKFNNIIIPPGVAISNAYITVRGYALANLDTVKSRITGNLELNPASFSTLADYQSRRGTVVGGADDLKITTAQVDWDAIAHFLADTWYNSPDISTVIQELINQVGWISGQSLALFWDDHDNRSTQSNNVSRTVKAYAKSALESPILHIEYNTAGILTIPYIGTWLSYPKIIITGPLNDAVITHLETGEKLQLDYHIPVGRTVTIDLAYGEKTVKDDLGTNLIGVLTSDSDLATFHIAPDPEVTGGLNHISVVGTGESVGVTQVEVQFLNRYFGI
jgi:hypothetical protein